MAELTSLHNTEWRIAAGLSDVLDELYRLRDEAGGQGHSELRDRIVTTIIAAIDARSESMRLARIVDEAEEM
jgi:hypothetical protein